MDYRYINHIDSPRDLKKVPLQELPDVCAEIRNYIIEVLSKNPGHLGSSLGTVELTVALHYVFDTPNDKLVWDVGHQAYAHKILTGRRDRFTTNRQFKGLAPFTNPAESEYDAFIAGHASNSISAALGIDIADRFAESIKTANAQRPATPERRNVVAIIGDGAMTGGLAFEGLNNTSMDKNNLLIVLNDNHMAIDPLKGGFTQYLVDLTTSETYNKWRWRLYLLAAKLHLVDERKRLAMLRRNNSLKAVFSKQSSNIFTGLNIRYFGPTDGHDVVGLVRILSEIKKHRGPKVLHIITKKGKGYAPAENDQTVWHAPGEFNVATGQRTSPTQPPHEGEVIPPLWQEVFGETLLELAKKNARIVGITPAMPSGCSMSIMQKELPDRVFDVGIAEGHAVTFSAGLAKAGMLPFCNIYSTFLQRAYDNIVHDVALQNLHVVFCIDRAGIVGNDGATHHGLLDLAFLRPIPNMQICAPRTANDLQQMLTLAATLDGPIAIRYPRGRTPVNDEMSAAKPLNDEMIELGKGVKLRDGEDVAVLTIGAIGNTMAEAIESVCPKDLSGAAGLSAKRSFSIAHYDMRWLKPLDENILHEVGRNFKNIVTAEDGMIAGGLGSAVLEWMADHGYTPHVIRLGINDQFVEHGSTKELYHMLKLDKEGLCESLLQVQGK